MERFLAAVITCFAIGSIVAVPAEPETPASGLRVNDDVVRDMRISASREAMFIAGNRLNPGHCPTSQFRAANAASNGLVHG